jgi:hypothetical protein
MNRLEEYLLMRNYAQWGFLTRSGKKQLKDLRETIRATIDHDNLCTCGHPYHQHHVNPDAPSEDYGCTMMKCGCGRYKEMKK